MIDVYNWSDIAGKAVVKQYGREFALNLYARGTSNAFLVAVYEYEENGKAYEDLAWFFLDESNAKRLLGLVKDPSGEKRNHMMDVREVTLYMDKCKDARKIARLFADADFPDGITISLCRKEV